MYAHVSGNYTSAGNISFSIFIISYLLSFLAALFATTNLIASVVRKKFIFSKRFTVIFLVSGLFAVILLITDPAGLFVNAD